MLTCKRSTFFLLQKTAKPENFTFGGFTLNKFEKIVKDSSGVSSVLGEILITGVFVLSLGSLFVFVNSIDTPVDSTRISVEEWVDTPSNTIYLRHVGGEPVDTKNLKIDVNIEGKTYAYSSANISENLGGKSFLELADIIEINTSKEWGVSVPDENKVVVKLIDTASREVLPKYRINFTPEDPESNVPDPIDPVDFEIINDTVIPKDEFIVSFTVLGAAFETMKETARIHVGNESFDPWGGYMDPIGGNVNDGMMHLWNLDSSRPAGTPISISGQSWTYNNKHTWVTHLVANSAINPSNVMALRNGDDVPAISGFQNQDNIAYYVDEYVKEGKIVLEENEVIYLFELWTTDLTEPTADFQDIVILVSLDPVPAS